MRAFVVFSVLAIVMLTMPLGVAAEPRSSSSCENVSGVVEAYSVPEGNGLRIISTTVTGELGGDGSSVTALVEPRGPRHFTGTHTFTSDMFGAFTTSDSIVVSASGRVNNTMTITDGASGMFHSHGTVDLATGLIEVRYHGRVCQ